ncbi:MAG: DUF1648 domain-containing protein [Methylacidiphilales bacterium]|nr:DUF1648 domain-containing protein [Candidatus Methylacidiphilales bacterium]
MIKVAIPLTALAICYVLFFGYVFSSYGDMPAKVASHFDIEGRPNGWMSREVCVGFTLGLGILVPVFVVGMMAGAGRIPVSFINLPHRDYWLAPERRQAALAVLRIYSLWLACMTVLFATGLHWLIVQANLPGHGEHLSGFGILFVAGGFLAGTGVWTALLLRHFSKIG